MGKATEALRVEHDLVLSAFDIVEDIMKSEKHPVEIKLKYGNEFLYFLTVFTDKCHHGKEETLLFPTMIQKGLPQQDGPIGILIQDHLSAHAMLVEMRLAIDSNHLDQLIALVTKYTGFIRAHIAKENNILYPMADKLLSREEQEELVENYLIYEEDVVGHGVHKQLLQMIDHWLIEFEINT